MVELEVGVRIHLETGVSFFGIDEVNALIRGGATVTAIEPAGVIMDKLGEDEDSVQLTLTGLRLNVRLEERRS
jgi:hypothetical protein